MRVVFTKLTFFSLLVVGLLSWLNSLEAQKLHQEYQYYSSDFKTVTTSIYYPASKISINNSPTSISKSLLVLDYKGNIPAIIDFNVWNNNSIKEKKGGNEWLIGAGIGTAIGFGVGAIVGALSYTSDTGTINIYSRGEQALIIGGICAIPGFIIGGEIGSNKKKKKSESL